MAFDPHLAAIRFGTGLSPREDVPASIDEILKLARTDTMRQQFPFAMHAERYDIFADQRRLTKLFRQGSRAGRSDAQMKEIKTALNKVNKGLRVQRLKNISNHVARGVYSPHGLIERLVMFWTDHFTAQGKNALYEGLIGDFMDVAIRPNVLGNFEDMLTAVVHHPLMLHFLDQSDSVGPNSVTGRRNNKRGINENLAREVLELHTLGVDGPYTQEDVQGFAALLTGLTESLQRGTKWNRNQAEPGKQTIMGKRYGAVLPRKGRLDDALYDLSNHPATAQHLAQKMAVHFVSDNPDPALVAELTAAYAETGGNLGVMTEVLLRHPSTWADEATNVKWPIEFITSGLRALGLPPLVFERLGWKVTRDLIENPLVKMGQGWQKANGPDGYAEEDDRWITPQGLAARLEWAMMGPGRLLKGLPDPREVLEDALGPRVPQSLKFAVESADQRREGLALLYISPAFQRR